METKKEYFEKEKLIDGLLGFLYVIFVNAFILPLNLWLGSIDRFADLKKKGLSKEFRNTEIPVFKWLVFISDALIVLTPLFILIAIISIFFQYQISGHDFLKPIGVYFIPILFSFLKELFGFLVLLITKMEKIEINTRKQD